MAPPAVRAQRRMHQDRAFTFYQAARAILHRLNPRTALRCGQQKDRKIIKFSGIANVPGRVAFYASSEHFRQDIPALVPRKCHDYLVAQNFMHEEFMQEGRPKVYFSREPRVCLSPETRENLSRKDAARFVVSFAEEDIDRRMFYVALPGRKGRLIKRLTRSLSHQRARLCCIINRYAENDQLALLQERVRFVKAMGADIDIFGHAPWSGANKWTGYPGYRGAARDKMRTLTQYNFNLCFENCDEDGYITEKIIQALMAGCVPLYWGGGSYLEQTIPAACFINCRDQDPVEIYQRIRTMSRDQIVEYRRAGLDFISSPQADRFTWGHWAQLLLRRLEAQS
ncbi:MAG TPA: glycosyltransferase family 10 [Xanthomonadales bacterium]|nr:glycosyltransferase family 10 [Xanthomonadales bacterium]